MVKIILAIFILGVIVALHEFGHFIVAKLCGIRVNQFAIGMGPAILKKQWGETEYSLRLLPIGGFCAMEGEDADSEDSRAFGKKSVPRRMAVVVAGATMNILLGFVLLIITTSMGDAITTTTMVLMAVARLELTPFIPIFASIDVSAAKSADNKASTNHIICRPSFV